MTERVVVETVGYLKGRIVLQERLNRVRWADEPWRPSKPDATLQAVRDWLSANDWQLTNTVAQHRMGTGWCRYFYEKGGE